MPFEEISNGEGGLPPFLDITCVYTLRMQVEVCILYYIYIYKYEYVEYYLFLGIGKAPITSRHIIVRATKQADRTA